MKTCLLAVALLSAVPVFAQHAHHADSRQSNTHGPTSSPYAGWQDRPIKALSDQQTSELEAGKGMSLALPAELNGYPGPAHVMELAGLLGLTDAQAQRTRELFQAMQAEARALGSQLIDSERELDRLFKEKQATAPLVRTATERAARIHGQLRAAHLLYHLQMVALLSPAQVAKYNALRGYQQ